jgi:hypothetical protein
MRKGSRIVTLLCLGLIAVIFMFISTVSADLTSGLVAHYPFNGNANDESGNGNNGTVYGVVLTTDRFGNLNSAYSFDGIDDYIKASAALLPTAERTVALWFYVDMVSNKPVLIGYGGSDTTPPGTSWLMGINHWGHLAYSVSSHWDTNTLQYYYLQDPVGAWVHYAITTDSSGTKIYINGVEKASNSNFINNTIVAGTDLSIGVAVNTQGYAPYTDVNVGYFVGSMDDVRIYNRAFSATEIQELYTENAPDLVVTYIGNIPAKKKRGGKFNIKDTVMNQGGDSGLSSIVRYYLSKDDKKDIEDKPLKASRGGRSVPALASGVGSDGLVKITIPKETKPGSYYVLVCADDMNDVSEGDENNNCTPSSKMIKIKK